MYVVVTLNYGRALLVTPGWSLVHVSKLRAQDNGVSFGNRSSELGQIVNKRRAGGEAVYVDF